MDPSSRKRSADQISNDDEESQRERENIEELRQRYEETGCNTVLLELIMAMTRRFRRLSPEEQREVYHLYLLPLLRRLQMIANAAEARANDFKLRNYG